MSSQITVQRRRSGQGYVWNTEYRSCIDCPWLSFPMKPDLLLRPWIRVYPVVRSNAFYSPKSQGKLLAAIRGWIRYANTPAKKEKKNCPYPSRDALLHPTVSLLFHLFHFSGSVVL